MAAETHARKHAVGGSYHIHPGQKGSESGREEQLVSAVMVGPGKAARLGGRGTKGALGDGKQLKPDFGRLEGVLNYM